MAGATTKRVDNGQTDAEVYVLRLVSGVAANPHPKSLSIMVHCTTVVINMRKP